MQKHTFVIPGSDGRPMATDLFLPGSGVNLPIVVYAHGFNGFKDWGNFLRIATPFTDAGLAILAFNFSNNGTTPQSPSDFNDLEAFGNNNYSKQLFDLGCVLDWIVQKSHEISPAINTTLISLIGHSMGGGMAILKASCDDRIKKVVGWASISHCNTPWGKWTHQQRAQWKTEGVAFYENKRTHQQMPLYYQLFEDYLQNKAQLDIINAAQSLKKPLLICHGLQDPAGPVESAYLLKMAQPRAELFITDGDHVFDRRHPAESEVLPEAMHQVVTKTISFILNQGAN